MTDKSLDVAFTETINETLSLAEEALKDVIYPNKNKEITPSLILNVVAEHFGVKIENIVSKNRTAEVAMARQVVMYLCREMTDSSLQEIGKILGGRDHTIIMHGVDKISDEINKNEDLKNKIDIIKKKINPFYACNEAINATDSYTPSAEYALKMLEYIAKDTEALKSAVQNASKDTEDGLAHMIDAREETNRELIAFYTRMYNDFKPEKPVPKSNTMTQFEEIANMLKTLNRDEFDDDAWEALMDAARAQLTRN